MILDFTISNFRSIKDAQTISFEEDGLYEIEFTDRLGKGIQYAEKGRKVMIMYIIQEYMQLEAESLSE